MGGRDWTPADLFAVSGAYWQSFALHAAVKLDLFTRIGRERRGAEEIAGKLNGDVRGVGMLLQALVAMGLLSRSGDGFENTPFSAAFLSRDSERYAGNILLHHHYLVKAWAQLDRAVVTGKPTRALDPQTAGAELESFLLGMFNLATAIAPAVAREVDLAGRHSLLDLGGGPGTYAVHFCLSHPGLRATVFDLPPTRPFAEKTVDRFGLSGRIAFREGNYLEDPLPGGFDVVWMSHILHASGPEDCQKIVDKAAASLAKGGMLLVHEFLLDDTLDGPLFPALFSLNMLVNTGEGQSYSEKQVREMFLRAGVGNVRRLSFRGPSESGILAGVV